MDINGGENMINAIIKFSVKNKGIIIFLTAALIIYGIYNLNRLPIDAVPDITNNQVQINTSVGGWSAVEIEKTVTFPIEAAVRGIHNAKEVRSLSRYGLSQVTVIFDDKTDIYRARQMVSERLQNIKDSLPEGVVPQLGPVSTGLGEIYQYIVEFKDAAENPEERFKQLTELRTIQDWLIKPRMSAIEGVAEINSIGGYERQIHIAPDPEKLASLGIYFSDIEGAIKNAAQNTGGGYVEQDAEQFVVQAIGFLENAENILNLPVKIMPDLRVINIRDIAKVSEDKEARSGTATYNGRESVLGTVMMMTGENSRAVAQNAEQKIKEISKDLPSGVEIIPVYSRSDLVNATISTVWHNILTGACLVVIILFLLVGNMRAAFITALTIPLALLITVICMRLFNISGNLMSLGALDFGIIIDGVVIVVDHCMRRLKERAGTSGRILTPAEIDNIVINASAEIRTAAFFGELILIVVFFPIFALVGIEAKMFQPMAAAFIFALGGALILSLTLAPALLAVLLRKNHKQKDSSLMIFLENLYRKLISCVLAKSGMLITSALIFTAAGFFVFTKLGAEFIPQLKEGAFAFHMIRPQSVSLTMSADMQGKAEKIILEYPEVKHVFSRIGTAEVASDPMGINVSDTYIILEDFGKGLDFDKFATDLVERLKKELPGQNYLASQPIQMRFNELLEGSRADLIVKIFGDDLKELEEIGEEIEEALKTVSADSDVELNRTGAFPVLSIEPDLKAMQRYGVNKASVLELVSIALSGKEAGYFFERDKRFPVVIRLEDKARENLAVIKKLPVPIFADTAVSLEKVANLSFKDTYGSINRDDGYRRAAIMANIRGMDTRTFVEKAQKLVAEKIKLPDGYFTEWGGQYKNLQKAQARLAVLIPLTLIAVFFMIYMAFNSVMKTALIFMGIPFAVSGGIFALYIAGLPFSISAAVGFIALLGIAVLNGMVLITGFGSPGGGVKE
jgi:cobalt-zinc-cadmium resistance protein CzcA